MTDSPRRMASATPDLRLPSQPQGITDPWPLPNYTAWWQRHACVNNLPKVVSWKWNGRSRTRDLLCHEPTPRSLHHQATYMYSMHLLAITTEVESFIQRKYSSILQTQLWIINYKKSPCYVVIICGINWYFKHTLCYLWNLKSGYICNVAEGIILIAQLRCVKTAIKTQLNMQHRWTLELNANAACTGSTTHSIPPT